MTINDVVLANPRESRGLSFEVFESRLDAPIVWANSAELLAAEYTAGLEGSIDGLDYFASDMVRVAIAQDGNGDEVGRIAVLTSDCDDYGFQSYAEKDSFFDGYEKICDESGFVLYVELNTCMLTAQELVDTFFAIY